MLFRSAKGADSADALIDAITIGQEDIAKSMIENGADVNAKNKYGFSALTLAASKGLIDTVNLLVVKGADTAEALLNAISRGQEKTAGILIERGADVNAKNKYGVSALMLAASLRLTNTVNLLIAKGADTGDSDFFHNGNSFCDESLG